MNTVKPIHTIRGVLNDLDESKKYAREELRQIILRNIDGMFLHYFLQKEESGAPLIDKIIEQILHQEPAHPYYMPTDFLTGMSLEMTNAFNKKNELFTIFMKDPGDKNRKVTITLK